MSEIRSGRTSRRDTGNERFPMIGGASLLVIFAVLCLTVFALLSLTTGQADTRLSDSVCNAVIAYYDADTEAEEILAQIRNGSVPENVRQSGDIYSWEVPVSDTQTLTVEAQINGAQYTVKEWKMVYTADWQPEERINVWDGEE